MTRIIVWTLVGLAVLAFVIFFVPQMRQSKREHAALKKLSKDYIVSDAEAYDKFVARSEKEVERFTNRLTQIKSKITNPNSEQTTLIGNLEAKITEFSAAVTELSGKTNRDERDQVVTKVSDLKKDIRTLIRSLGGKASSPEDTSGE